MNRSALPAALVAVCCALLAGTVLRAYHVPLVTRAVAQSALPAPAPFDPYSGAGLRPARPGERQKAVASIAAQLAAFNADDYNRAVRFQSMTLRQNFPSVTKFRSMILSTYPQFAHSRRAQYGPAQAEMGGGHVLVPVTLTGRDGTTLQATYIMVREGACHRPVYRVEGVLGGARPPLRPIAPGTGTDA